jgi:DNA-binding LacI/PurR family transcriptional regulator
MGSKPTIRDVAKEAGVSIATVSYVLNRNSEEAISDQVKERVLRAVRALNYHRAAAAVSLARQRTRNIGMVLYPVDGDVTNPFYSFVIQGVIREAIDRDYNLLFSYVESKYRDSRDLPKIIREANVVGVIFVGHYIDAEMVRDIRQLGIAVVGIDHGPRIKGVASVQIDNHGGGELAGKHLLDLGHRHLAFVGPVTRNWSIVQRWNGYNHALDAAGGAVKREVLACDSLTFREGYSGALDLLKKNTGVTAAFCANDEVAAGVLRAAHELGRSVPRDLSVVGFDDIIMAKYTDPPLTTVSVGKERMGRRAAARLLEVVDENKEEGWEEVAPVELVLRSSTAPPPPAGEKPRKRTHGHEQQRPR